MEFAAGENQLMRSLSGVATALEIQVHLLNVCFISNCDLIFNSQVQV